MSERVTFEYDEGRDVATICGTRFSGELLRSFGSKGITRGPFEITDRTDGVVILRHYPLRASRSTHTYAVMEVSDSAYEEIAQKMRDAGYDHVFGDDGEIDMHGIAIARVTNTQSAKPTPGSGEPAPGAARS